MPGKISGKARHRVRHNRPPLPFLTERSAVGTVVSVGWSLLTLRLAGNDFTAGCVSMLLLVFLSSFFRGGRDFGYAALTAAFTTPVLLFGGERYIVSAELERWVASGSLGITLSGITL